MNQLRLKKLFHLYMIASYGYYVRDVSVLRDDYYDRICLILLRYWNKFDHKFKHLTDEGQLMAGSGYAIRYPVGMMRYYDACLVHWEKNGVNGLFYGSS